VGEEGEKGETKTQLYSLLWGGSAQRSIWKAIKKSSKEDKKKKSKPKYRPACRKGRKQKHEEEEKISRCLTARPGR